MASLSGTALELYKACLEAPKSILTQQQLLESVKVKDQTELLNALNALLKKKLFTLLKNGKNISYKAVRKAEAKVKSDMDGDESLVYSHIEGSGNEGIWTKTLKTRTNLHQTVLNRCLKTLEQKMLVKSIKSVKFPTRKIYMLAHLTPSTDISGGPWYTDHEFDTEFIKTVMSACLAFIKQRSFPSATSKCAQPIYSVSYTKKYPNVNDITAWMRRSKIADTDLNVEHVQALLDVLVYDGEIEALPSFGIGTVDADSESENESDSNDDKRKKKKGKKGKGKGKAEIDEDEDEDMGKDKDGDGLDDGSSKRKKKRSRADVSSGDDSDHHRASSSKRKKRKRGDDTESEADSDEEGGGKKHKSSKRRKKSRSRRSNTESDSDSDSGDDSGDDSDDRKGKKKKKSKSSKKKSSKRSRVASPEVVLDFGASVVYRAVRHERIGLGWSQAPCGRCPQFEFCHDKGPVNARGCNYYSDWFDQPIGIAIEESEQV